jgi:hypothetical protein
VTLLVEEEDLEVQAHFWVLGTRRDTIQSIFSNKKGCLLEDRGVWTRNLMKGEL